MLLKLYEENPNPRDIQKVINVIRSGGVIIYPTDTMYGIGCDIYNPKAVGKVAELKGLKIQDADFSFICHNLSLLSLYARHVDNTTCKLMKRNLPGPFTFILNASSNVPKIFKNNKKTIGIRVPNNPIILNIVHEWGQPLLTTSIEGDEDEPETFTNPELIHEKYKRTKYGDEILVIDGGHGNNELSTVIDCTGDDINLLRQGVGNLSL